MTFAEWQPQWARLAHLHISSDANRNDLEAEWFAQLKHYHVDAVSAGVTELIGHAKDNFLPGLGLLKDFIQTRLNRYDRAPGKCQTCNGTTWVEADPWKSNGLMYEGVRRCPDCGVPAPKAPERPHTHTPTDLERHEYQAGRYGRDQMPEFAKAKHPEKPGNPELREMIAAFKKRFTQSGDDAA